MTSLAPQARVPVLPAAAMVLVVVASSRLVQVPLGPLSAADGADRPGLAGAGLASVPARASLSIA